MRLPWIAGSAFGRSVSRSRKEQRTRPCLVFDHHRFAAVFRHKRVLDVARGVIDQPAHLGATQFPEAELAVGGRFGQNQGAFPVRVPAGEGFDSIPEVEQLAVLLALDVHQPDLSPGGVAVGAGVQDVRPRRVQLGDGVATFFGPRQRSTLTAGKVVQVDPGFFCLFAALGVHVCPVDQPVFLRVQRSRRG